MKYCAIIFDMDGVLLDSTTSHAHAFKIVLSKYGIDKLKYEDIAGMHTKAAFERVFKENGLKVSEADLKKCIEEKRNNAYQSLIETQPIMPSVKSVVEELSKKYKLALASSASERLVDWFLNVSGTSAFFQLHLSGDDVTAAKPSPEIYLLAAKKMSLSPKDCLVIEDALSGIESAVSAGMDVFVKLGTLKTIPKGEARLKAHFNNLDELLGLL